MFKNQMTKLVTNGANKEAVWVSNEFADVFILEKNNLSINKMIKTWSCINFLNIRLCQLLWGYRETRKNKIQKCIKI